MRLRLIIQRHQLPPVRILFNAADSQDYLVSKLLEQVNEHVPLEASEWGLEDYVVSVDDFECIHYLPVTDILKPNDQVTIRAIRSEEFKVRSASGRYQISNAGIHLIDGVAFGRTSLRRVARPPVNIPPRKKRRILDEDEQESAIFPSGSREASRSLIVTTTSTDADAGQSEDQDGTIIRRDPRRRTRRSKRPISSMIGASTLGYTPSSSYSHFPKSFLEEDPGFAIYEDTDNQSHDAHEDTSDEEEYVPDVESGKSTDDSSVDMENRLNDENVAPVGLGLHGVDTNRVARLRTGAEAPVDADGAVPDHAESAESSSTASTSESETDSSSERSSSDSEVSTDLENSRCPAPQNPPGTGSTKTKARNERRRWATLLSRLKVRGDVPADYTITQIKKQLGPEKRGEVPSNLESLEIRKSDVLDRFNKSNDVDMDTLRSFHDDISNRDIAQLDGSSSLTAQGIKVAPKADTEANGHPVDSGAAEAKLGPSAAPNLSSSAAPALQSGAAPLDQPTGKRHRTGNGVAERFIFNALGHRVPRDDADRQSIRDKLASKKITVEDESVEASGSKHWSEKLQVTAVECVEPNVTLSAPPFPFEQYWEGAPPRKPGNKKRKRGRDVDWSYEDEGAGDYGEATYYDGNANAYDGAAGDEDHDVRGEQEGEDVLCYDDTDWAMPVSMPEDPTSLDNLSQSDCREGAIIAFKQFEVSAMTRWTPGISPYKLATVSAVLEDGSMSLFIAGQEKEIQYDERGRRLYDKFETEDEGFDDLIVSLSEMVEPKLVQAARDPIAVAVEDSQGIVAESLARDLADGTDAAEQDVRASKRTSQASGRSNAKPARDDSESEFQPAQRRSPEASEVARTHDVGARGQGSR